jgi:hypothetical protein
MILFAFMTAIACADTANPEETNEEELITTVELTFVPTSAGDTVTATWADVEGSGTPTVDAIVLSDALDYSLAVRFLNELEDPAEDITTEVSAESDEHQVFLTGSALAGPATGDSSTAVLTHTYADADANGLPVGLSNAIATTRPGNGTLTVTLRHLPEQDGTPTKTADLAETVAADGFAAIGGESDVSVDFAVTVE